ncbi:hypothetical protein [Burkholderia multivorans]|uniref:hypothetical protein n=1 Tax=Burkholderia multivorans TaxID=87883 RepID=UPI0021AC2686|nr:hypothetical protein [Burkholderia multivorans]
MVDGHGWNEVKEENARSACRTARHGKRSIIPRSAALRKRHARADSAKVARRADRASAPRAPRIARARIVGAIRSLEKGARSRAILRGHIAARPIRSLRRRLSVKQQKAPRAAKSAYAIRHAYSAHAELSRSLMPPLAEITDPHS